MSASVESLEFLNRITIAETNEPLVDLRTHVPDLFVAPTAIPLARRKVAEMLLAARAHIPKRYGLYLHHALRTKEQQADIWQREHTKLASDHPDWPSAVLNRETNKRVAPLNAPTPPGHCTGGAIDVLLTDNHGTILSLPIPPPEDWSLAITKAKGLSEEQRLYRSILYEALTTAGFSNYPLEFWHYSYGDSAWAARNKKTSCPYGYADYNSFLPLIQNLLPGEAASGAHGHARSA